MKYLFIISFCFACFVSKAGDTIYISNAGNAANDGKTPASSWPFSKVQGNAFYGPGFRFLFKRGETYNGTVSISANASYNNISPTDTLRFGAYGEGPDPIITTREKFLEWDNPNNWTEFSPNVWQYLLPLQNAYPRIWLNKGYGFYEASKAKDSSQVTSYHPIVFQNTRLPQPFYLHSVGNPATTYTAIEYPSMAVSTFLISNQKYVVVENLDIRGAAGSTIDIEFSEGVRINKSKVGEDAGHTGIRLNSSKSVIFENSILDSGDRIIDSIYPPPQQGVGDGFYVGKGNRSITARNNLMKDWGHSIVEITDEGTTDSVNNVLIIDNYLTAPNVDYCRALGVNVNVGKNIVIDGNIMENYTVKNQVSADSCLTLQNNIINNVTQVNSYVVGTGVGLYIAGYSSYKARGMKIINNVFANCRTGGIEIAGGINGSYEDVQNNVIANNVFYKNGYNVVNPSYNEGVNTAATDFGFPVHNQLMIRKSLDVLNNTYINNNFYTTATPYPVEYGRAPGNNYAKSAEDFNLLNGNAGDVIEGNFSIDPLFVSESNFRYQTSSPLYGSNIGLLRYPGYTGYIPVIMNNIFKIRGKIK